MSVPQAWYYTTPTRREMVLPWATHTYHQLVEMLRGLGHQVWFFSFQGKRLRIHVTEPSLVTKLQRHRWCSLFEKNASLFMRLDEPRLSIGDVKVTTLQPTRTPKNCTLVSVWSLVCLPITHWCHEHHEVSDVCRQWIGWPTSDRRGLPLGWRKETKTAFVHREKYLPEIWSKRP